MIDEKEVIRKISTNLIYYRKKNGYTQQDLANLLSYSDKAVSKWERGLAVPDVIILLRIAEIYNISLSELTGEVNKDISEEDSNYVSNEQSKYLVKKHNIITLLSIGLVWLVAAVLFFIFKMIFTGTTSFYLFFIYAVPVSAIVWLVFNILWGSKKLNILIESILSWTLAISVIITIYPRLDNPNIFYILLIPLFFEILIVLWNKLLSIKFLSKNKQEEK